MLEPRGQGAGRASPDGAATARGRVPAPRGEVSTPPLGLPAGRARGPARRGVPRSRASGSAGPRAGRAPGLWGSRPGRLGVFVVIGGAVLGMVVTVAARTEPGSALGVAVVAGTAAAALAVRPRSVYVIIPVPALAYVAAATTAGLIHDRADDSSLTGLAVHAAQWIASGFVAMSIATLLAIAVTAVRWPRRGRGRP
jgi:hypothetical protein